MNANMHTNIECTVVGGVSCGLPTAIYHGPREGFTRCQEPQLRRVFAIIGLYDYHRRFSRPQAFLFPSHMSDPLSLPLLSMVQVALRHQF